MSSSSLQLLQLLPYRLILIPGGADDMEIMIENLRELIYLGTVSFYLIIVLIVLSCITVSLRLWVRCRITKSPGWDDAAMVATLVRRLNSLTKLALAATSTPCRYCRFFSRQECAEI